jgi:CRISPR/Cas system-associated exonuclease Cas4 (RecB family)
MLKREYRKYGRCYIDESTGVEYPGVTSILNIMEKRLDWWKMDMSGKYILDQVEAVFRGGRLYNRKAILAESKKAPDDYRDSKGALGTHIHNVIECRLNKEDISCHLREDPKLSAIMVQINKWITDNKLEPVLVEAYLLSKKHQYAGGVDLVARQETPERGVQLILVDFKTGKSIQDVAKWQLAAYCAAYEEMYGEKIDIAFLQHISYDKQIIKEASHLHKDELPEEFDKFLHIYGAFRARWKKELHLK